MLFVFFTVLQGVFSVLLVNSAPMFAGAVCLFELAVKGALELVTDVVGLDDSNPFGNLLVMCVIAIEGLVILLLAIQFAKNQKAISNKFRALLNGDGYQSAATASSP